MQDRSFADWLKHRRKALDLTQASLADQVGCSAASIRKIEAEERRPSAQIAERLARIFSIPPDEQAAFLRFARGDWKSTFRETAEPLPWHASSRSTRSNLPAPLTSLIGRDEDIARLHGYLLDPAVRLVTLVGPPGIGKTRLGTEAARTLLPDFPDGVFFVALAPLSEPALLALAIAQALDYIEAKSRPGNDQLIAGIADKQILLVLDNCEHLIEDISSLASVLLSACPRLKILTTSRESLRISGEWVYPVPALPIPKEISAINMETVSKFPGLILFAERARAVRPDFVLNEENIKTVFAICAHLDGLPLVIELIAARMRLMSPQALLERLNDQFILSADGMRAATARQKTLNDAIDWSYNLLSLEEQKLFACLSVFSGGFTLEAAESIFSGMITGKAVSNLIASLSDKNLLQRAFDARGGIRFIMLVTIQQFALNNLRRMGNEPEARNRHLAYFCELAEEARPHFRSSQQLLWLDRLEAEYDNIRAALDWAQDSGAIVAGLHLATDLEMFWIYRAYYRGPCLALENLLAKALPDDEIQALARGHLVAGLLRMFLGNLAASHAHAQESERLCLQLGPTSKAELADARNLLIYTDMKILNNPIRARQGFEGNLRLLQEAGHSWLIAHTLFNIGNAMGKTNDFAGARRAHEESLAGFQACGDKIRVASQIASLAYIAFEEGKFAESRTNYEKALSFYRQAHYKHEMDDPLYMLGAIAIREQAYARAQVWYSECLLFAQEIGKYPAFAKCLIGFAGIANAGKSFERAARLVGAAGAELETRKIHLENFDRAELQRLTTVLRDELGEARFDELADEGRAMTVEHAVAYALEDDDQR